MNILAIETTSARAEVAVVDEIGVAAAVAFRHQMDLAQRLMPRIDGTLQMAGLALAQLDGIAVSLGPGSFTGIRIGVVTAKALAFATGIPLAGVPTLEAMATAEVAAPETLICAVIPARADELYAGLYQHVDGALVTRADATVVTIDELSARLKHYPGPVLLVGEAPEAATRLADALGAMPFARMAPPGLLAAWVAVAARERLRSGGEDPATLAPRYVRASSAVAQTYGVGR